MIKNISKNENGFSAVAVALVAMVLVVIGASGYVVYKKQDKTTNSQTPVTTTKSSSVKSKTTVPMQSQTASSYSYVNVVEADHSVIQVTPDKIAKTKDEANILTALHNGFSCTGSSNYITVGYNVFDGNDLNFKQNGNYAEINASVCSPTATTFSGLNNNDPAERYLHKSNTGTWVYDASTIGLPVDCTQVDGLGYPSNMISRCYDGSTTRAPKQQ
jgi:hypothetical protein